MRKLLLMLAAVAAVAVGIALWLRLFTLEHHTGYFGPAFSPDGRSVYAVVRDTTGLTWGAGWEHFTPPAHALPLTDRIRLIRIDAASGTAQTLESWDATPVAQRVIREYRGRVFNIMTASVRANGNTVAYSVGMAIPVVPASEVHQLSGTWSGETTARQRGEWRREGYAHGGLSEPVLAGQTEVFALRGPESYPSAVVLLDHTTMRSRVIAKSAAYDDLHPAGPQTQELLAISRKQDIERIAAMQRKRDELVAGYRARGMNEIEALLKSGRDLEDLGYLPKSTHMVARRLDRHDASASPQLPMFDIADAEMASGIFPDLEKALAEPGTEIDKTMGKYIAHRDYANSEKLNAYLAGGGLAYLVRYRGTLYRIDILRGR
jgi:hypothetical protein